jgi:hypothetical protein
VYDAAYRCRVYELPPRPRPVPPLVRATTELRTLVGVLGGLGALLLAGALVLGDTGRLSPLETADVLLVFGLSTGASAAAAAALGAWTSPRMLYRNILDRAPGPPPEARRESGRRTQVRTVVAGVVTVAAFLGVATVASALLLVVMGKPRSEIPHHLPTLAALIGGGWALACAGAAWLVARWLERWEELRGRRILCAPLHAAILGEVYFTTPLG